MIGLNANSVMAITSGASITEHKAWFCVLDLEFP
jgi:hypothetical protein